MNDKPKDIIFKGESLNRLAAGLDKLADAVKVTLGPRGRNVIIERGYGSPSITKDGVSVAKEIDLVDPFENMGAQMAKDIAAKTCDEAGDGPQPLYSKVLTPNGYVTMGEMKVGDTICGTSNTKQEVLGVFPKGVKEIVKVSFSDGRSAECCEDHLWEITTNYGRTKVLTVREMLEEGVFRVDVQGQKKYRFYTPRTSVDFSKKDLKIDPYLLGVLLGDGSLSSEGPNSGYIEISLGEAKGHIIPKLILPEGFTLKTTFVREKNYYRVKIKGKDVNGNSFHDLLASYSLLGTKSTTKFIPKDYLYSSLEDRQELLQGLLDTDGYINSRGLFEFSTVSNRLKTDFEELCRSMGYTLYYKLHRRENDEASYSDRPIHRFNQLKGYKYGLKITDITKTGKTTEMQCIKVSNPDNLYITDDYVVTHNTTTATVLAQAITRLGLSHVIHGNSPVEIKRGMDKAVDLLTDQLREDSFPVDGDLEIIRRVGTISANNEKAVGDVLADAIDQVGRDGVITIEESGEDGLHLELVEGMELSEGYMSRYLITEENTDEIVFENPVFFIVNKEITMLSEVVNGMNSVLKTDAKPPIILICKGMSKPALDGLLVNVRRGSVRIAVVRAPGYREHQENLLQDIAVATGATVFGDTNPVTNATVNDMGQAEKVTVTSSKTLIVGPIGDAEAVLNRVQALRTSLEKTSSEYDKEKILERIAKLSGAVAVIRVGGRSEVEVKELRDRVEDAMHATRAAVEEGIVPGGGVALLRAREASRGKLAALELNEEQAIGAEIVFRAVEAPLRTILHNAGIRSNKENAEIIIGRIVSGEKAGYNAYTGQYEDLLETGVIDPVKVTMTALRNAVSIAGMLLTSDCSVVYDRDHQPAATIGDF
jgi:chaperonin GroEL